MPFLRPHIVKFDESQKKLKHRWELIRSEWNDPVSHTFERQVMLPLFEQIRRTQNITEQLLQILEQAHKHVK